MMSNEERLAVLETKISKLDEIDRKLDSLLELRAKGAGAFWLASALVGTGIISMFWAVIDWIK